MEKATQEERQCAHKKEQEGCCQKHSAKWNSALDLHAATRYRMKLERKAACEAAVKKI